MKSSISRKLVLKITKALLLMSLLFQGPWRMALRVGLCLKTLSKSIFLRVDLSFLMLIAGKRWDYSIFSTQLKIVCFLISDASHTVLGILRVILKLIFFQNWEIHTNGLHSVGPIYVPFCPDVTVD